MAVLALIAGAFLSAFGGYLARRREDIRSRRADLLVDVTGEAVWALQSLQDPDSWSPYGWPTVEQSHRLDSAVAALYRHAIAASRADANRIKPIFDRVQAISRTVGMLRQGQKSEDDLRAEIAGVDEQLHLYVDWLVKRLAFPL